MCYNHLTRKKCGADDGKPCDECTKEGAEKLLWLECVRPKFDTISVDVASGKKYAGLEY
jgi:hypothetical protein